MKYQGKFPVISLGLKEVTGSSYQKIEEKLKMQITTLYDQYVYLQDQAWLTKNQRNRLAKYLEGQIVATDLEGEPPASSVSCSTSTLASLYTS